MIDLIITIKNIEDLGYLEEIKLAILLALEIFLEPDSIKFYYPNYAE